MYILRHPFEATPDDTATIALSSARRTEPQRDSSVTGA